MERETGPSVPEVKPPWKPRGIEIRGEADILETGGQEIGPGFDPEMFCIRPRRIISWGLDDPESFSATARSVR